VRWRKIKYVTLDSGVYVLVLLLIVPQLLLTLALERRR